MSWEQTQPARKDDELCVVSAAASLFEFRCYFLIGLDTLK